LSPGLRGRTHRPQCHHRVIPAKAGIQCNAITIREAAAPHWIPAVPGSYVAWTSVRTIASMEWVVGGESAPTFQRHIVLYRRRERPLRIVLPEMDDAEREQLWVILSTIAARYHIEIVSDETEAGRAWLRRRPLFEEYL
jgi:hypothetical protein